MKKFESHSGIVAPIDIPNVDTDAIIPKQFLKSIYRTGFGDYLFDEWRYLDQGEPGVDCQKRPLNQDFVLNQKRYKNATILLARENFGCGSSREHAPWALDQYGFKVLISSSFADIFYNNCFKNGILPIKLVQEKVDILMREAEEKKAISVNLEKQIIVYQNDKTLDFEIDKFRKKCLIEGLDDIGLTLQKNKKIDIHEEKIHSIQPWIV